MNFALAPSAALLVFSAARYYNVFSRLLTSRPAIILGDASYSIYLVHYLVLVIATSLIGSAVHGRRLQNLCARPEHACNPCRLDAALHRLRITHPEVAPAVVAIIPPSASRPLDEFVPTVAVVVVAFPIIGIPTPLP